jgi:molybdopterin-guanine dinucleotide biosynthesis protein B
VNPTNTPFVIGFYGESNSGKTTLIIDLVQRLINEGLTVATVKQTDKPHGIDTQGKDTWKHAKAGAHLVVFSSTTETDYLLQHHQTTKEILQSINLLVPCDIVLIEGAQDEAIPKIRLGSSTVERYHTVHLEHVDIEHIMTYIHQHMNKRGITMKSTIEVKVNGKPLPLTEFPAEFITSTILGMLSSLKGVDEIQTVEIILKQ